MLQFNNNLKLIFSDVDETIADLYVDADPKLISKFEKLLIAGKVLFLISGGSLKRIETNVVNHIEPKLRKNIIVSQCSSAQIFGYDEGGERLEKPYYDLNTGKLSEGEHAKWRELVNKIVVKFNLKVNPPMPMAQFSQTAGDNPNAIMLDDRGVQITMEVINAYDLDERMALELGVKEKNDGKYDLRYSIIEYANSLFKENSLPIYCQTGGVFAINFVLGTNTKGDAVKFLRKNPEILKQYNLEEAIFEDPALIEVWGDKFSNKSGPNDWTMSVELHPECRSISFRQENPEEFPKGYNIQMWDGEKRLHDGLLEFLEINKI